MTGLVSDLRCQSWKILRLMWSSEFSCQLTLEICVDPHIGNAWAAATNGKELFCMPMERKFGVIDATVSMTQQQVEDCEE